MVINQTKRLWKTGLHHEYLLMCNNDITYQEIKQNVLVIVRVMLFDGKQFYCGWLYRHLYVELRKHGK